MLPAELQDNTTARLGHTMTTSRLETQLRQAIDSGQLKVGDKVATIRNLAEQYGLSFDATRGVIAKLEKLGYLHRKRGSGTFVADRHGTEGVAMLSNPVSSRRQNKTVALLLDNKVHHYGRFYDQLVDCLQLGGYGTSVFTWRQGWGEQEIEPVLEQLEEAPPHAIVIQHFNNGCYDERINQIALKHGTRVISSMTGSMPRPANWHSVYTDTQVASAMAARRLLDQGHQNIGVIVHDRTIRSDTPIASRKRSTGHSNMIIGAGHEMRKDGIRHGLHVYYHHRIDDVKGSSPMDPVNRELVRQWLSAPNCPTAFIGEDFRMAALLRVAQEHHIQLPDNFQVVGVGNTPWAALMEFPSVWLREDLVAEHVMHLVKMEDRLFEGVAHRIVLEPQLVERP